MAPVGVVLRPVRPIRSTGAVMHYWYMGDIATNPMATEIVRRLADEGRFTIRLETGNLQAVVDARWAARQAGQILGRRLKITTTRVDEPGGGLLVTAVLGTD